MCNVIGREEYIIRIVPSTSVQCSLKNAHTFKCRGRENGNFLIKNELIVIN